MNGHPFIGTGTLAFTSNGTYYALTCGHNVCQWDPTLKKVHFFKHLRLYEAKHGDKNLAIYKGIKAFVHPKYQGASDSGYDIGIIQLELVENNKHNYEVPEDEYIEDCF